MKHITILGAGYAGMLAALRLHKRAHVTLISREATFVERIRLHQAAAGQSIRVRPIADMLRGTGVTFIQANIAHIDAEAHTLSLIGTNGTPSEHAHETLIYALGSHIDRDALPGVRAHAQTLDPRGFAAVTAIAARGGRIVLIGGGLTGIEAASELAEAHPHAHITLITQGEIGAGLSDGGREHVRSVFAHLGVTLIENRRVTQIDANTIVTDNDTILTDGVLWAGAFAVPSLARDAGITVNARGQIVVDAALRSVSHPDILVAGDSACVPGVRMACATAMPMGAHAADVALGSDTPFRFGFLVQCISLGRRDGLIQFVNADDSPQPRILTGRAAATFKELICHFTVAALGVERRLPGIYAWRKSDLGVESASDGVWAKGIA
ncbi:MAG: FAD-dependent oxidoreductase [Chloroflexota bacterium]|nr:FAD-dependent oxidoreductase [Chloroflexota bacterium]